MGELSLKQIQRSNMDQMNSSNSLTGNEDSGYGSRGGSQAAGVSLDTIKEAVADKLHAAAGAIQQKAGQKQLDQGGYIGQAAGWLDNAAEYVRDVDPQRVKSDLQKQVRSNPGRSLLIAGAAGLFLGILLRR
jgi:ElaB/YqjD/DUF883 family membrane-anchored ribosome-binding protein